MPGAGLEADAAAVEGDALADQRIGFGVLLAALVIEHDQPRRLLAALGHGEEGAHAQFLELLLVEHVDLEVLVILRQCLGLLGEEAGMAQVRWQVAKVAGQCHAGGDCLGMLGGALDVGLAGRVGEQDQFVQFARLGLFALETVEYVAAVHQAFHGQAGAGIGIAVLDQQVVEGQSRIATAQFLEHAEHGADQFAELLGAQRVFLAATDQQDAFGLEVRHIVQQQGLAQFAGQIAALEYCNQRAAAGGIHRLGLNAQGAAFADNQHQSGGFHSCRSGGFDKEFHAVVSPRQRTGFAG